VHRNIVVYKTPPKYIISVGCSVLTGEWRKLHNEELNDLYPSPSIVPVIKSGRIRWTGHVASMRERASVYMVLVGKPEGKRALGRPRRRWEDNIEMGLQEVGCGGMDWIGIWTRGWYL
jgi:hypothetical protein